MISHVCRACLPASNSTATRPYRMSGSCTSPIVLDTDSDSVVLLSDDEPTQLPDSLLKVLRADRYR